MVQSGGGVFGFVFAGVEMKIYFKKLTDDLLEVCRMLDDKPDAKAKLSEITVDVSFLPDVGYGIDKEIELPAERLEMAKVKDD